MWNSRAEGNTILLWGTSQSSNGSTARSTLLDEKSLRFKILQKLVTFRWSRKIQNFMDSVFSILHKRLSVESVLKHINSVQTLVFSASLNISFPKWSSPFKICCQTFVQISRTLPFAFHYSLPDLFTKVCVTRIRRLEINKHHAMQHFSTFGSSLSGPNNPNTLNFPNF
jgi:hypothetical protein